ncbi:MAG: hypothetical protein ACLTTH_07360 [Holdemanella porci]
MFEVVSVIEQLMAKNSIQVVHGKGKRSMNCKGIRKHLKKMR